MFLIACLKIFKHNTINTAISKVVSFLKKTFLIDNLPSYQHHLVLKTPHLINTQVVLNISLLFLAALLYCVFVCVQATQTMLLFILDFSELLSIVHIKYNKIIFLVILTCTQKIKKSLLLYNKKFALLYEFYQTCLSVY